MALMALLMVALPGATARADTDLVARRQACTEQARAKVKALGRKGVDALQQLVQRRQKFVQACMGESGGVVRGEAKKAPERNSRRGRR
jgi:hypothetical protein